MVEKSELYIHCSLFIFALTVLIANYQDPAFGEFLFDFVRTRVFANGTVQIEAEYLMTDSYKPVMDETFVCAINKGALFYANAPSSSSSSSTSLLPLFRSFIVGHFDNSAQVAREQARGCVEHPLAVHVSDVANQKIDGVPAGFAGVFVLEETYYTNVTTGTTTPSPFLFLFTERADGRVQIASYTLPARLAPGDVRNNNTQLRFDFNELVQSPTFTPAAYTFDARAQVFALNATTVLSPTQQFVLIETVSSYQIRTLEQVLINGHNVMPFATPIEYARR